MIQTGRQSLGGYTFYWDPDKMTIPEKKKDVAIQKTYGGSAVFEWPAQLQGKRLDLIWRMMPKGQYKKFRQLYLAIGTTYIYDPNIGGNTYNVKIIDIKGGYHEVVLADGSFRTNATLSLDCRSLASILQSTSTTTSTTTTTV